MEDLHTMFYNWHIGIGCAKRSHMNMVIMVIFPKYDTENGAAKDRNKYMML